MMDKRRLVLVGVNEPELLQALRGYFENEIQGSVVFTASDGTDLLLKASRTRPHLVIFSSDIQKTSAQDVFGALKEKFPREHIVYLFIGAELPNAMKDEHSLGNLIWVASKSIDEVRASIAQALNALGETSSHFKVKHLAKGEVLMREGEAPEFLYFVLKGSLTAFMNKDGNVVQLGRVKTGEFVGEMAVINGEKRVATVHADDVCQLLEIPARDFNRVVLTKPSWAKALMSTLTKRLKFMNAQSKRP